MKILVAIASYGTSHDAYLERLLAEYRSMRHEVHIVVLSNLPKPLGADIEVLVGLPTRNPWSLPFGHKKVFAERAEDYDLFIYSEDDHLITERNIDAFTALTPTLLQDEIAGFMVSEKDPNGGLNYCGVHSHFHWKADSVRHRGDYVVAEFSNEHSACYAITRAQLRRAIQSGGFLVEPHEGKYDLLCTAATDPYTQCGFRKVVCVSHLDDFIVSHLPNKYVGVLGVQGTDFYLQREALLQIARGERETTQLLAAETNLPNFKWSKYYYEPARTDVVNLVPAGARSVLSVGCGWGALEESLIRRQIRVVGIPLDSVIATCAEARGVETLEPDFQSASKQLEGEQFDCVLISNVLHLLRDPTAILARCAEFLSLKGCIVLVEPNFVYLKFLLEAFSDWRKGEDARGQSSTFVRPTTHRLLRRWLKDAGFTVDQVVNALPRRMRRLSAAEWRFLAPILARDVIVRARRASVAPEHRKASRSSRRGPDHEGVARPVRVEVSQ